MTALIDKHPPPYRQFMAFDGVEMFQNYLVKSEFNYFYLAGRPFTHWIEIN